MKFWVSENYKYSVYHLQGFTSLEEIVILQLFPEPFSPAVPNHSHWNTVLTARNLESEQDSHLGSMIY